VLIKHAVSPRNLLIAALLLVIAGIVAHLGRLAWGAYQYRAAEAALARRDFPRARQLIDPCLRLWPKDGQTLLLAAQTARRDGALDEATRWLDAAEQAGALAVTVAFERSLLRLQTGDSQGADHFLQVCVEHPAAEESPLILEAVIIGSLQRVDLARARTGLDLWDQQKIDGPARIQSWIWRGELAIRTGDVDTAANFFRQAVESDPGNDQARLRLAELLARFAPHEALTHLDHLRDKPPDDRDVLFQRARCHRSLGEHEQAGALLHRILRASPRDYEALLELGQIAMELRQFEAAERRFRAALAMHPERRDPNLGLAQCLQLAGKSDEAQRYREIVARIDEILNERLRLLREKGSFEP
jgi:tetratricopeptide (TPR) repeat protein